MTKISEDPAVQAASSIPAWTDINERECLARLAREVPAGGSIVEIGCLYGGMTAVLALANPEASVLSIDNFSWTPEGYPKSTAERLRRNMKSLGIKNSRCEEGDSREFGTHWEQTIDLLWIDGGHSYDFVYSDLIKFGPHAEVIALHDYDNPDWPTIRKAVEDFIEACDSRFFISEVVGMVVVLRWKE